MLGLSTRVVRGLAAVALGVYVLVLVGVAFLPLPGPPPPYANTGATYNLVLARPNLLGGWEAQRNVLMLVPFGVLLPLVVRGRYEVMVLACVVVPLTVETGQLLGSLFVGWAWRSFDVNDLFNNTVGGLLGLALSGAVLTLSRRPPRLPLHRLVTAALAIALLVWAVGATLTTPPVVPVVYACDHPPTVAVTRLPGGAEAYAGSDGGLCLQSGPRSSSLPPDTEPGPHFTSEDGRWELGVALPGTDDATDGRGIPVELRSVDGTDLLVWASPVL